MRACGGLRFPPKIFFEIFFFSVVIAKGLLLVVLRDIKDMTETGAL